jgi:hypothetical protein
VARQTRTRRKRRTAKQVMAHGRAAKRRHTRIGGRTGKIRSVRLKSLRDATFPREG